MAPKNVSKIVLFLVSKHDLSLPASFFLSRSSLMECSCCLLYSVSNPLHPLKTQVPPVGEALPAETSLWLL